MKTVTHKIKEVARYMLTTKGFLTKRMVILVIVLAVLAYLNTKLSMWKGMGTTVFALTLAVLCGSVIGRYFALRSGDDAPEKPDGVGEDCSGQDTAGPKGSE